MKSFSHGVAVVWLWVWWGSSGVTGQFWPDSNSPYKDPDEDRNVSELITSKGYPVQEYIVNSDGYLLSLIHIPQGRPGSRPTDPSKVVYFQHGILASADCFVLNFPEQDLPYILADLGYDVWLGSYRGTTPSRRHLSLPASSAEFWDFGMDELALVDLPNLIDRVLQETGVPSLYYIGHSQGTLTHFALLSERTEYNTKIRASIALAPVSRLSEMNTPIRALIPMAMAHLPLARALGLKEIANKSPIYDRLWELLCRGKAIDQVGVCSAVLFMVGGYNPKTLNMSRMAVYSKHVPTGTSLRDLVQLAQMYQAKKFQKYDYGRVKNRRIYRQDAPPEYDPTRITAPTALFVGANDYLATVTDAVWLWERLQNRIEFYLVPDSLCAHYDFIISLHAHENIYPRVIDILERY